MKAKISPGYKIIDQKPYCCVPACIQMILYRRNLDVIEQEDIGIDLGLVVPKEEKYNFKNVPAGRIPKEGYGTRINIKKYSLNEFFKKRNLPLVSMYSAVNDIENVPEYIGQNISLGNDLLVCFRSSNNSGHASLIEEIDDDIVTLVDPEPKIKKVSSSNLIKSVKEHNQFGGFWLIETIK